jgi:PAS domain S-box-containing protein
MKAQSKKNTALFSSHLIKSYLGYVQKNCPQTDIDSVLAAAAMDRHSVEDPAHWFSQETTDRFVQQLMSRTRNPQLPRQVGRHAMAGKGVAPLKRYTLGLINLEIALLMLEKIYPLMTRGTIIQTKRLGLRQIEIVSKPKPGVIEKSYQCENRMGVFESLAAYFSAPSARIDHPACLHRGDQACRYVISWTQAASSGRQTSCRLLSGLGLVLDELDDMAHRYRDALLVQQMGQATALMAVNEQEFRQLLEGIEAGCVEIDLSGTITYVNGSWCRMTGYSQPEVIGTRLAGYGSQESAREMNNVMRRIYRTEQSVNLPKVELIGKAGNVVQTALSACLLRSLEYHPIGLRAVLRDLTEPFTMKQEKVRLEAQLLRAHKMETLGQLAGGIAHNVNNFLMGIQGNLDFIRKAAGSNTTVCGRLDKVEEILDSAAQLNRQIVRRTRGRHDVTAVDLNRVITETFDTLAIMRTNLRIHLELFPELHRIHANRNQIEQVLWNLFINAADALPQGGDIRVVTSNTSGKQPADPPFQRSPGDYVRLSFCDNGVGMDPETKQRIFEPFFTTKAGNPDAGLGLASVHTIINNHEGYIQVESEKGRGTTFTIWLPVDDRKIPDRQLPAGAGDIREKRILMVEDQQSILDAVQELLGKSGYTILPAKSAEEALRIYHQKHAGIGLVILDMAMPDTNGMELFAHFKAVNPKIRVLFTNGYDSARQAYAQKIEGSDDISKLLDLPAVIRKYYRLSTT